MVILQLVKQLNSCWTFWLKWILKNKESLCCLWPEAQNFHLEDLQIFNQNWQLWKRNTIHHSVRMITYQQLAVVFTISNFLIIHQNTLCGKNSFMQLNVVRAPSTSLNSSILPTESSTKEDFKEEQQGEWSKSIEFWLVVRGQNRMLGDIVVPSWRRIATHCFLFSTEKDQVSKRKKESIKDQGS